MTGRYYLGGGIGSGKSTAAACFASLGAVVVSADAAGHRLLAPGTDETAAVARRWPEVVTPSGAVDRAALGRLVFADPGQLRLLEDITAPGIRRLVVEAADAAGDAVVLVEVPVLRPVAGMEVPWIVVDAPDETRVLRTVARGMEESQVRQVMSLQPTRGEWLAAATWVVDNSGERERLADQCRRVWEALTER